MEIGISYKIELEKELKKTYNRHKDFKLFELKQLIKRDSSMSEEWLVKNVIMDCSFLLKVVKNDGNIVYQYKTPFKNIIDQPSFLKEFQKHIFGIYACEDLHNSYKNIESDIIELKNTDQIRYISLKKNKKEEGLMIFPKHPDLDPKNQQDDIPEEYLEHSYACKSQKTSNILLKICEEITREQNLIDEEKLNTNSKEQSRQKRKQNRKLHENVQEYIKKDIKLYKEWKIFSAKLQK